MVLTYLYNIFLKHPTDHEVTYIQHCIISLNLSKSFFIGSIKAFIHSFIPSLFETSSTDCIQETTMFMNYCYDESKRK